MNKRMGEMNASERQKILILLIPMILFTSCNKTKTISYYQENEKERTKKLAKCMDDVSSLQNEPNCMNAYRAQKLIESYEYACESPKVSGNSELINKYCKGE